MCWRCRMAGSRANSRLASAIAAVLANTQCSSRSPLRERPIQRSEQSSGGARVAHSEPGVRVAPADSRPRPPAGKRSTHVRGSKPFGRPPHPSLQWRTPAPHRRLPTLPRRSAWFTLEILMPHLLGLALALCTPHCPQVQRLDAVQLRMTPARIDVCLLHATLEQDSCIGASRPDQWAPVHAIAQTWRRLAVLVAHDVRIGTEWQRSDTAKTSWLPASAPPPSARRDCLKVRSPAHL